MTYTHTPLSETAMLRRRDEGMALVLALRPLRNVPFSLPLPLPLPLPLNPLPLPLNPLPPTLPLLLKLDCPPLWLVARQGQGQAETEEAKVGTAVTAVTAVTAGTVGVGGKGGIGGIGGMGGNDALATPTRLRLGSCGSSGDSGGSGVGSGGGDGGSGGSGGSGGGGGGGGGGSVGGSGGSGGGGSGGASHSSHSSHTSHTNSSTNTHKLLLRSFQLGLDRMLTKVDSASALADKLITQAEFSTNTQKTQHVLYKNHTRSPHLSPLLSPTLLSPNTSGKSIIPIKPINS
jgi:hypothetical protein